MNRECKRGLKYKNAVCDKSQTKKDVTGHSTPKKQVGDRRGSNPRHLEPQSNALTN
jgi:hypothetical protein